MHAVRERREDDGWCSDARARVIRERNQDGGRSFGDARGDKGADRFFFFFGAETGSIYCRAITARQSHPPAVFRPAGLFFKRLGAPVPSSRSHGGNLGAPALDFFISPVETPNADSSWMEHTLCTDRRSQESQDCVTIGLSTIV